MSDKITKTVVFEIEPSGGCGKCENLCQDSDICFAFRRKFSRIKKVEKGWKYIQLQACKDYLSEQKNRGKQDNNLDMSN